MEKLKPIELYFRGESIFMTRGDITGLVDEYGFSYQDVAYIGDDLPDIPALKKVGFSACPNDAVEEVKQVSQYVSL